MTAAGYVTTDDVERPASSRVTRRLRIPNLEVRELFRDELIDRANAAAGGRDALAFLHKALTSGDAAALACELERVLLDTVSYHDLRSENSCHMWLLSLLYGVAGYRYPRSNREVGRGRPDLVCEPDAERESKLPAIVVEVKFERDATEERLQRLAESALGGQALPSRYSHGLAGAGTLIWSVAFDNHKHVAVARAY